MSQFFLVDLEGTPVFSFLIWLNTLRVEKDKIESTDWTTFAYCKAVYSQQRKINE